MEESHLRVHVLYAKTRLLLSQPYVHAFETVSWADRAVD